MLESDCDRRVAMAMCAVWALGRQGARTPRPTHGKCHTDYQLDVCDPFHVGEMPHTPLDASTFRIYQNYSVNATVNKRKGASAPLP